MPLKKSTSSKATEENFHEVRHGKTYARTKKKFGRQKANKQMVAIVLSNKRKAKRMRKRA
jgi:hypothetical protein